MKNVTYLLSVSSIACVLLSFTMIETQGTKFSPRSFYLASDGIPTFKCYARDSTKYSDDKNIVSLFGDAKVTSKDITIIADEIVYNAAKQTLKISNVKTFEFKKKDERNKIKDSPVVLIISENNYKIVEND